MFERSSTSDSALRDLALRLLATPYPGNSPPAELQLLVGHLPDGLPLDVPIPDRTDVVGTYIHGYRDVTILLDSDLLADQVLTFYEERLRDLGWRRMPDARTIDSGGFAPHITVDPPVFRMGVAYCRTQDNLALRVHAAAPLGEDVTQVRLDLDISPNSPLCIPPPPRRHPFPTLAAPADTRPLGLRKSSGEREFYSRIVLEAEAPLVDLAAHYIAQLESTGWRQTDAMNGGAVMWSTWSRDVKGEGQWHALLICTQHHEGSGHYLFELDAELQ